MPDLHNLNNGETPNSDEPQLFFDDIDSSCSTPYVSAPSSPGRSLPGFFYSAPASPMHFAMSSKVSRSGSFEFESSGSGSAGSMSSADELFLNGQIRPMKLSTHLEQPVPDLDLDEEDDNGRCTEKSKSQRRRTRSMSPLRNVVPFQWIGGEEEEDEHAKKSNKFESKDEEEKTEPSSSSRSSSVGRNSKRWMFLKDILRSKSEGRSNNKFWPVMPFSPAKEKKSRGKLPNISTMTVESKKGMSGKKPANGVGKRPVLPSPHEVHYTTKRAQAEELRRKTYLPYRQGLFGCLGFSSKGYGAMNGLARAWNPVPSR